MGFSTGVVRHCQASSSVMVSPNLLVRRPLEQLLSLTIVSVQA